MYSFPAKLVIFITCMVFSVVRSQTLEEVEKLVVTDDLPKDELYNESEKILNSILKNNPKVDVCENYQFLDDQLDLMAENDSVRIKKEINKIKEEVKDSLYKFTLIVDDDIRKYKIKEVLGKFNLKENEKFIISNLNEQNALEKIAIIENIYNIASRYHINRRKMIISFSKNLQLNKCKNNHIKKYIDSDELIKDLKHISEATGHNYYLEYKKLSTNSEKIEFIYKFLEVISN